jgi:recombination associated protein RdgC
VFFRNLTLFRFPVDLLAECALDLVLAECALKPVGPMELSSRGFVTPLGGESTEYAHHIGTAVWITLGGENKVLPAAAVNKATSDRIKAAEERLGLKISGRQRKRYKQEALEDMIPKAFVQPSRLDAYLDLARGFIAVDTSSRKQAEGVIAEIRAALGSFPALPLNAEVAPRAILTGWLAGEPLPEGLTLDDEIELRDAASKGAVVKMQRKDLSSQEVAQHLEAGMHCVRIGLTYKEHVSFVLGEDLVVRKFKLLDGAVDSLEDQEHDTIRAELDARFALMSGEIGELFDMLEQALRLTRLDDAPGAPPDSPTVDGRIKDKLRRLRDMAREDGTTLTISGPGIGTINLTGDEPDPLLELAEETVRNSGKTTISGLQRVLKIGYNRAAHLIESLELRGVVSPPSSDGTRTVLSQQEPA